MKILLVHNRYQQRGGEDTVFEEERKLLIAAGISVASVEVSNNSIVGRLGALKVAASTVYSLSGRKMLAQAIQNVKPDIVHIHNFFPLLSPSIFDACKSAGVPSVLTLHNFRLVCAGGILLRNDRPCEDCIGHLPWRAVYHKCYRNSTYASVTVAAMIGFHNLIGTWSNKVDGFVALSDFARDIFVKSGIAKERIFVKPNFVFEQSANDVSSSGRMGYLYVGRLSPEKGIVNLLKAWENLELPLTIVGDGPLAAQVKRAAIKNPAIEFRGLQNRNTVLLQMAKSKALILPSICYEMFPLSMIESLSVGTPVIASRIGALATVIEDGVNGAQFDPWNALDLRNTVLSFECRDDYIKMSSAAKESWRKYYSNEAAQRALLSLYESVIDRARVKI